MLLGSFGLVVSVFESYRRCFDLFARHFESHSDLQTVASVHCTGQIRRQFADQFVIVVDLHVGQRRQHNLREQPHNLLFHFGLAQNEQMVSASVFRAALYHIDRNAVADAHHVHACVAVALQILDDAQHTFGIADLSVRNNEHVRFVVRLD